MEIVKVNMEKTVILHLSGRLDSITSSALESTINDIIIQEEFEQLEINMFELLYLSSAGLRVLLGVHKKLNSLGAKLVITNANESIRAVFDITGFLDILNII